MVEFTVTWEIEVDADSHEAAAREARRIQLDPNSIATVFWVRGDVRLPWLVQRDPGTTKLVWVHAKARRRVQVDLAGPTTTTETGGRGGPAGLEPIAPEDNDKEDA